MTDIKELFSGIGIVIDDALENGDKKDSIWKILEILENNNIPTVQYSEIPESHLMHFKNCSFLLLDWDLVGDEALREKGVKVGEALKKESYEETISFLKKIKEFTFLPVFIFSYKDPNEIIEVLVENDLYNRDKSNFIFISRKSELLYENKESEEKSIIKEELLFEKIESWLKDTPSIYVLKEWENALDKAKCELFWSFYDINPNWASVLKKAYTEDGTDANFEINDLIFKNLTARTNSIQIDNEIVNAEGLAINKDDVRKILEGERYLSKNLSDKPRTGDIFTYTYQDQDQEKTGYLINIRPDCDYIRKPANRIQLYCLKGRIIDEGTIDNFADGSFTEKISSTIVAFIDQGKIIEFQFFDMKIIKWETIKNERIGRLLPPYLTRIQQRYAFYLHRQGLPRIPNEAMQ